MSLHKNDIKTFKVENYGTFFLQKLQNFFNKTDYCDLTLQFNDNSQLKVHRLVLSACTDYFNILEQTCEMVEDLLIMPNHLQADVIVPIVNFMYTGTFEFQFGMYEKLLKTAREMNMTVLSKLLEAHRQPSAVQIIKQPIVLNKNAPRALPSSTASSTSFGHRGNVVKTSPNQQKQQVPHVVYKHHQTTIKPLTANKNIPEPIQIVTKYNQDSKSRPSRFNIPDEIVPDTDKTFDSITYESKPLLTASQARKEDENSPFESLRKGYTNKRIASSVAYTGPPPVKKLNLEEVKEMTEAQRQRSSLADTDDDDDYNYDGDTNFNEEYEEEDTNLSLSGKPGEKIKQNTLTKQITVKDEGGNVNHAKIISEVLKKYPHLVKNHKNIKLKIMQRPSQSSKQTTAIVQAIKQEKPGTSGKIVTSTPAGGVITKPTSATTTSAPKRIDAKTMHALIAKGAENMTGPWLCLKCGVNGRPISIPSYKSFRKHLITVHNEKIDPRICEHCGFKVNTRLEMYGHLHQEHQIKPPPDVKLKTTDINTEQQSVVAASTKKPEQQCIYCNKTFTKEFLLYAHMRAIHRHKAKSDGVMDFTDEEDEEYVPNMDTSNESNKIKIISNVSLAPNSFDLAATTMIAQQPSSEAEALSNVATGIATSLGLVADSGVDAYDNNYIEDQLAQVHGEYVKKEDVSESSDVITKLITEDGTELQLTQSQKEEILQQLQTQGANLSDNVVMVLDQGQFEQVVNANDNNVVVMYSQTPESLPQPLANMDLENAEIVFQTNTVAQQDDTAMKTENLNESGSDSKAEEKLDDKNSLISQLEGDWNVEEEDKNKVLSEGESVSEPKPVDEEKIEKELQEGSGDQEETSKKLKNLLDDWSEDEPEDIIEKQLKEVVESGETNIIEKIDKPEIEPPSTPSNTNSQDSSEDQTEEVKHPTVEEEMQFVFGESGDDEISQEKKLEESNEESPAAEVPNENSDNQESSSQIQKTEEGEEKSAIDGEDPVSKDAKSEEISSLLNEWNESF